MPQQQFLIVIHVRHYHLQLVVRIHPGHEAALQHLRQGADGGLEILEAFRRVTVHADQYISGEAQAEHLAVEQGDLAGDVAVVLQLLDPA